MAGEDAAATNSAEPRKTHKEEEDDDELDNVPLALARGKKASNASASKVKKEQEDEDELDNLPLSHSRATKGNEKQKSTANSNAKASKVKKEENDSDDDFEPTLQKKNAAAAKTSKVKKIKDEHLDVCIKEEKKRKKGGSAKGDKKMAVKKEDKEKVKKERKVYELPGQKHDPPAERDPLRIFYESLYEQVPTSDLAATWLMEWGLLQLDVARKVFEKKQGQKVKSPVKTISAKRKPASPTKKTPPSSAKKTPPSSAKKTVSAANNAGKLASQKKRKASSDEDDDDDDFMAPKTKTKRPLVRTLASRP